MGELHKIKIAEGYFNKVKEQLERSSKDHNHHGKTTHYFQKNENIHYILNHSTEEVAIVDFGNLNTGQKLSKLAMICLAEGQESLDIRKP